MKKIGFILLILSTLLYACGTDGVKIRGKINGLKGTVKLFTELPGDQGMTVLVKQDVVDGNIDLQTDKLNLPARVWVDIAGKKTFDFIVDTKDQTWIEGKIDFPDEITIKGSGIEVEYGKVKELLKEKYAKKESSIDNSIKKLMQKENMTKDDEVMIGIFQLRKQRNSGYRAKYIQSLVEANPTSELSLFLIEDELSDSTDLQKRLFENMKIENKESNVYRLLEQKLR